MAHIKRMAIFFILLFVFPITGAEKDAFCGSGEGNSGFCNAILYAAALQGNERLLKEQESTPQCFNGQATRDALVYAVAEKRNLTAARYLLLLDRFYRKKYSLGILRKSFNGLQESCKTKMGTSMAEFFFPMAVTGMAVDCQLKRPESINWGLVGSAIGGFGAGFVLGWYQYDVEKERRKKALENSFGSAVKRGSITEVLALQDSLYDYQHQFKFQLDFENLSKRTVANGGVGAGLAYTVVPSVNNQYPSWYKPATLASAVGLFGYIGKSSGEAAAKRWYFSSN